MAIYHLSISNISRAKGSSSCATLSYISAEKVYEERTGNTYSYGRKERVIETKTLLPKNAPVEFQNAHILFNNIENFEKAENARTAKKIEVALPRELKLEDQKKILDNFINTNITKNGYACTYALHTDKHNNNPHAHIIIANRQINNKGQWGNKRKMEYVLDEQGNRVPRLDENGKQKTDKNGRKQWKRINVEQNLLDKKEFLIELRESWAIECNKFLDEKIDHRSYEEQGVNLIPTIHEGYASREIEKRGELSERAEINRQIKEKNKMIEKLEKLLKELKQKAKEKGGSVNESIRELLQRSRSSRTNEGIRDKHRREGETPFEELRSGAGIAGNLQEVAESLREDREARRKRSRIRESEIFERRNEEDRKEHTEPEKNTRKKRERDEFSL